MDYSSFTVRLVVLLLPGLLATVLIERLTVHPKWEQFRFAVYSLILGCSSYVLTHLLVNLGRRIWSLSPNYAYSTYELSFWRGMFDSTIPLRPGEVAAVSAVAVLFAMVLTRAVQGKWMHKIASKLKVSDKYGDENLFTYFLNTPETGWLWIRDHENSVVYEGYKDSWSEDGSVCELVLTDVKVFHAQSQELLYEIPGKYFSFQPGQLEIEMAAANGDENDAE